jgi:hypothetical protein
MGAILLHHPLVQFFLLYLGGLWFAVIWNSLRRPAAPRTPPREVAQIGALAPSPACKHPAQC